MIIANINNGEVNNHENNEKVVKGEVICIKPSKGG